ncbi:hypothetical protein HNP46_000533 [Pseudomonas nitritireducens]|uniref:Uncharacterized protein n=1 Tax=Pseudomonas nitroreducens TaxID=46680 RepID=A0A7W7KF59_PSENT|nr:hypothetical protein [Pseudomonas nitritireducens]MBB4861722.1 hypothetical protein [Pseudomonas nitritireducens]
MSNIPTHLEVPYLWALKEPQPRPGTNKDSQGRTLNGFDVRETKHKKIVRVLHNGYAHRRYSFPRDVVAPKHPMIRWLNLPMAGMVMRDEDNRMLNDGPAIIEAVFAGHKPIVDVMFMEPQNDWQGLVERVERAGMSYEIHSDPETAATITWVMFGSNKPMGELFDLGAIAGFYGEGTKLGAETFMKRLVKVADLNPVQVVSEYDWKRPESLFELMLTGLCLGYPLESTLAIMLEWA